MEEKQRKSNWSELETNMLIELVSAAPVALSSAGRAGDRNAFWRDCANQISSISLVVRTWQEAKKKWSDLKCATKRKAIQMKSHARLTGGGPPAGHFRDYEEKILTCIPGPAIDGIIPDGDLFFDTCAAEMQGLEKEPEDETPLPSTSHEETCSLTDLVADKCNSSIFKESAFKRTPRKRQSQSETTDYSEKVIKLMQKKIDMKVKYEEEHLEILREKNNILKEANLLAQKQLFELKKLNISLQILTEQENNVFSVSPVIKL